ncbi:TPA: hypothetical protein DIC20_03450 [Candidatus Dependentiae bacterium]|nr:hypothetical protein [Candidatus Dependentiae bacterium]HCU00731.1 hypothetical protein [Candidatus Dependentiae bacterium]
MCTIIYFFYPLFAISTDCHATSYQHIHYQEISYQCNTSSPKTPKKIIVNNLSAKEIGKPSQKTAKQIPINITKKSSKELC